MRKGILLRRALFVLAALWLLLTGYKVCRKVFTFLKRKKTFGEERSSLKSASLEERYYSMPETKKERREHLGRSTWTLLHTVASKYPEKPTREEQTNIIKFIDLLTKIYPCDECRPHFKSLVGAFPPKVSSNGDFATWMCQAHNLVNSRLGKPEFDCTRLDSRWDCGCK